MTISNSDFGDDVELEEFLKFLRETRSLDFTGYKRPSLSRRIRKRMDAVGAVSFDEYRDHLEVDAEEQSHLVDTVLINVTSFFRDEAAWTYLREELIPTIANAKGPNESIRIWSAGCASGEEAYSLAFAFADHLGLDDFRARVKIFATDNDEEALNSARRGVYADRDLESFPESVRQQYFEPVGDKWVIRSDYRRQVIFGRNDLTTDAPISRLDMLVCRNVLMYFVSDVQRHVLKRFHYALNDGGFLFLGRAETIMAHSDLFEAFDNSHRVFVRRSGGYLNGGLITPVVGLGDRLPSNDALLLQDLAQTTSPVAQIVVDADWRLVGANARARTMFGVSSDDFGRPLVELRIAHDPLDLRPRIEQAYSESRPAVVHDVERTLVDGQKQFLEVSITPLFHAGAGGLGIGVSVTYSDVTELIRIRFDLECASRDLEIANVDLVASNEELGTSNEELQSTNEELETTNEELQSANEELETTNEELQSANEELETMNEEFIAQTRQIEAGQRFLSSVLASLPGGVVVVDEQLDVVIWNRTAEELFGVRDDEVRGRSFLALDIGLPVADLATLLRDTANRPPGDASYVHLDAVNRRGQPLRCRIGVQRLTLESDPAANVVVLIEAIPEASR